MLLVFVKNRKKKGMMQLDGEKSGKTSKMKRKIMSTKNSKQIEKNSPK